MSKETGGKHKGQQHVTHGVGVTYKDLTSRKEGIAKSYVEISGLPLEMERD